MPVHACIVGSLGILGKGVRRHGENRHRPRIGLYGPADDENLVNGIADAERLVLEYHFAILDLAHVEHIVDE